MSIRSNMTTSRGSSIPDSLRFALDLRTTATDCPPDVSRTLSSLPYFSQKAVKSTTRFTHLTSSKPNSGGWNEAGSHAAGEGFEVWSGRRRRGAGYSDNRQDRNHSNSGYSNSYSSRQAHAAAHLSESRPAYCIHPAQPTVVTDSVAVETGLSEQSPSVNMSNITSAVDPSTPKFSSAAMKAVSSTEDRILAKVKGKINKIGFSTYDATKTFMQQILDSNETEFLDEFMNFVFQKAATESTFCPLYAKLLHELADEFTHLRVVIVSRFKEYTSIFTEVTAPPDAGTESYREFVEAQERKKYRRGYSQFVAEMVKLGEVDKEAFGMLIQQIVTVLEQTYTDSTKTLLCEEYIDCLANMCKSASSILNKAEYSSSVKTRLTAITAKSRAEVPGLTSKARFALMDLVDSANRGWK